MKQPSSGWWLVARFKKLIKDRSLPVRVQLTTRRFGTPYKTVAFGRGQKLHTVETGAGKKRLEEALGELVEAFRAVGISCDSLHLKTYDDGLALIELLDPDEQDAAYTAMEMVDGSVPRQLKIGELAIQWPAYRRVLALKS